VELRYRLRPLRTRSRREKIRDPQLPKSGTPHGYSQPAPHLGQLAVVCNFIEVSQRHQRRRRYDRQYSAQRFARASPFPSDEQHRKKRADLNCAAVSPVGKFLYQPQQVTVMGSRATNSHPCANSFSQIYHSEVAAPQSPRRTRIRLRTSEPHGHSPRCFLCPLFSVIIYR